MARSLLGVGRTLLVFALSTFLWNVSFSFSKDWTGEGDGNSWEDGDNWDPQGAPGSGDDATIFDADVRIGSPVTVGSIGMDNGSLQVDDPLTLEGESNLESVIQNDHITHDHEVTVEGISQWKNGDLFGGGDFINSGEMTVSGGLTRLIQSKKFINDGSLSIDFRVDLERATLENSGTLEVTSQLAHRGANPSMLVNTGTLSSSSANGEVGVHIANNGGTVQATGLLFGTDRAASLLINRGSTFTGGKFNLANNATIHLEGLVKHSFQNAVTAEGEGNLIMRAEMAIDGQFTNKLTGDVGLETRGFLGGSGELVNEGRMTWNIGTIEVSGGVTNNGTGDNAGIEFGVGNRHLGTTLTNNGTIRHHGGGLNISIGGQLDNESDGVYEFRSGSLTSINGPGIFENAGWFEKSGEEPANVNAPFDLQGGTLVVGDSELRLAGGGESRNGRVQVFEKAKLLYSSGIHHFEETTNIIGAGIVEFKNPATVRIEPGAEVKVELFNNPDDGSRLDIAGNVTIEGKLENIRRAQWTHGTLSGGGEFLNLGELTIAGSNTHVLSTRLVNHFERNVDQKKTIDINGGRIVNRQRWHIIEGVIESDAQGFFDNERFLLIGQEDDPIGTWIDAEMKMTEPISEIVIAAQNDLTLGGGGKFSGKMPSPSTPVNQEQFRLLSSSVITKPTSLDFSFRFNGTPETYLITGNGSSIGGTGTARILPNAILEIADSVSFTNSLKQPVINNVAQRGFTLAGGMITGNGRFVNIEPFFWNQGEISIGKNALSGTNAGVVNYGRFVIESTGNHVLTGHLINNGSQSDLGTFGGTVDQFGNLTIDNGRVTNQQHATWQATDTVAISATGTGLFTNKGEFLAIADEKDEAVDVTINGDFDNQGKVVARNPAAMGTTPDLRNVRIRFTGNLLQYNIITQELEGGTWEAATRGTRINFPGPIKSTGPTTHLIGGTPQFGGVEHLELNRGMLDCLGECELNQELTNEGTIRLQEQVEGDLKKAKFRAPGVINKPTKKVESAVDDSDGVTVQAGLGRAIPTFELRNGFDLGEEDFINEGIILPGGPQDPGAFPLTGHYVQTATGVLETELAGIDVEQEYDRLFVNGRVALDGALQVSLLTGFEPALGHEFEIIRALEGVKGEFSQTVLPTLTDSLSWSLRYEAESVWLEVLESMGTVLGDYNGNGQVEQGDLDLVLLHWGQSASAVPATWVHDHPEGQVDQNELDAVLLHWGETGAALGARSVPEPASLWLLITAAIGTIGVCRKLW